MNPNAVTIHHNIRRSPPLTPPPPPPAGLFKAPHGGNQAHQKPNLFHMTWGKNTEVLFSGWPGSSSGMYALSLIFVFGLAVLVEMLSHWNLIKPGSNRVASCLFRTGLHVIRAGFAYMVILAVMSYNGGVFIAAVLGHAAGFVVFGSGLLMKASDKP
ncbi:unnamed protein product [Ilex paraguariensis]|uniref:Copper transport protein n=1 Tax=Ilex paraguariensis TaxID=185542 RepID=A0ABC8UFJ1_9AQUA